MSTRDVSTKSPFSSAKTVTYSNSAALSFLILGAVLLNLLPSLIWFSLAVNTFWYARNAFSFLFFASISFLTSASVVFLNASISCSNTVISLSIDGASASACKSFAAIFLNIGSAAKPSYILLLLSNAL